MKTSEMTNMIMKNIIIWRSVISQLVCVPDKLFADGAEGRLREERGTELVTFDNVNFSLFDGTSPVMEGEQALSLLFGLWVSLRLTCSVWNTSYKLYLTKENGCKDFTSRSQFLFSIQFNGWRRVSYQQFHFDQGVSLYHLIWMSQSSLLQPHFVIWAL